MKATVLESLLNKATGLQVCNFIKSRLQHGCFPVIIAKFLRITILKNHCERHSLKSRPEPGTLRPRTGTRDSGNLGHGTLTHRTLEMDPWNLGHVTPKPRILRARP